MLKRGYEFSFAWIFAIFIGAIIIFLAIYTAVQLIELKKLETETEAGKQISILTNPVETNLESAKKVNIIVISDTRIINDCLTKPETSVKFGWQSISTQIRSGIGDEWRSEAGFETKLHNKYLFSNRTIEAKKNFQVLSKPFFFPFKIADIIIIWPDNDKYCFVKPSPQFASLEKEITDLELDIEIKDSINGCSENTKKVCFPGSTNNPKCDIKIDSNQQSVTNMDKTVYYAESFGNDKHALLYAAIFSSPEIYECQIKRLKERAIELSLLYKAKADYLDGNNCPAGPAFRSNYDSYNLKLNSITNSKGFSDLDSPSSEAYQLYNANENLAPCKQF